MFGKYLSAEELSGFDKYKYKSVDTSPISNYITHPFWNFVVEYFPKWLPPNLMTFSGWCCLVAICVVTSYYDPHFTAGYLADGQYIVPRIWWLLFAVGQFVSHTLDGCDGKQARRTNSSTPLGELFDHGLDSMAAWLIILSVFSMFGFGNHSIGAWEFFFLHLVVLTGFFIAHWEKYNTGILYLPWAYDASQLLIAGMYLLVFLFGHSMFKYELFENFTVSHTVRLGLYMSSVCVTFPVSVYNVYKAHKSNSTRSVISPFEGMMPLVPLSLMFILFTAWAVLSPNNVYESQPRLFCVAVGIAFSNINCRLIVATMCGQSCERFNSLLYPLMAILCVLVLVPVSFVTEFYILVIYTFSIGFAHLLYGVSVVNELCDHLGIRCFSLQKP